MNIQTHSPQLSLVKMSRPPSGRVSQETPTTPSDQVTLGRGNDIRAAAIMGGIGLVGAAVGALSGNYSGVLAGIGGAVVGGSAGASLAVALPGEKVKTGALLGAISGAIAGASFGNTAGAVAMGVAGATLPFGAFVGLASSMSA